MVVQGEAPQTLDSWYRYLRLLNENKLTSHEYALLEQGTLSVTGVARVQFEEKFAQSVEGCLQVAMRQCGEILENSLLYGDVDRAIRSVRETACIFERLTFVKQCSALSREVAASYSRQIELQINAFWDELEGKLKMGQIYTGSAYVADIFLVVKRERNKIRLEVSNV